MINIDMKPQGPVLEEYAYSRERVTFIQGPLGSGKTIQSCLRIFSQICEQEPDANGIRKSRWYAVRNTYPDLMNTTIKDWLELFGELPIGKFTQSYPPLHKMDFDLPDGTTVKSELIFLALDRPDAVKKLRGAQATGFWLNEVKELQKEIVDMCDLRHGRYPENPTWHGMIGDYNAPDTDHWIYKLAEETRPEGWRFLRQAGGVIKVKGQWIANPLAENINNLPAGYYTKGLQGKTEDWISVNLGNNYGTVVTGQPIYKDHFSEQFHIADHKMGPIKKYPISMGFDFGLTPAVAIGQLTHAGQLRITDELVAIRYGLRGFLDEVVIPFLSQHYPNYKREEITVWYDPSGDADSDTDEESCGNILREYGFAARPARTNDPKSRWEAVRWFLSRFAGKNPAFQLCPSAITLKKGFISGYQFRRLMVAGDARYDNKADKNKYSHPHDALQYLCLGMKGNQPDWDIPTGIADSFSGDSITAY